VRAAAEQGLASDQQQREGDAELRGFVRTLLSERELAEMLYRGGHAAAAARHVAWRGRSYAATVRCIGFYAAGGIGLRSLLARRSPGHHGWCSSTAAGTTGQPKAGVR
jgi:hypothetical protein